MVLVLGSWRVTLGSPTARQGPGFYLSGGSVTTLKVYMAGSSRDLVRVCGIARQLDRSPGLVTIVDRWFDDAHEWAGTDSGRVDDEQERIAEEHERNIRGCDLLWWLYCPQFSGSLVELGIAIGAGIERIVVTGSGCRGTVFSALADFRHESDLRGLHEVFRAARERPADLDLRRRYEAEKRHIAETSRSPEEYETRLAGLARRMGV